MEITTYNIGGGWGDRIEWSDLSQFGKPREKFDVTGWKIKPPRAGDLLEAPMRSGNIDVFEFLKITQMQDPADMFFAVVGYVGRKNDS